MKPEPGISGYPTQPLGEQGEYELREVSFALPPPALRDIARFLVSVAGEMDKGPQGMYWHRHIYQYVKDWRGKFPDIDVVVGDLRTYS